MGGLHRPEVPVFDPPALQFTNFAYCIFLFDTKTRGELFPIITLKIKNQIQN